MKILICSDIHGDLYGARKAVDFFESEKCDKLLILGDILYHGPRNSLPDTYDPKGVIELLNSYKEKIIAVRGNCDTEVDQMVLDFPVLADYTYIFTDGLSIFATHGHKFNEDSMPPMSSGDILLHGHTHVYASMDVEKGIHYLNPGSVSLPKNGNPKTYMTYENRTFEIKDFNSKILLRKSFI